MPGNNTFNAIEEATLYEIVSLNLYKNLNWKNIQKQYKARFPHSHKTAPQLCAGWKEIIKKSKRLINDEVLEACVNNPICKKTSGRGDIDWPKVTELYNEAEHPYHKEKKQLYQRWVGYVLPKIRKITCEERKVIYAFFKRTFGQFIQNGKVSHTKMLAALMADDDFINFHTGKETQEIAPCLLSLRACYHNYIRAKQNKEAEDANAMAVEQPCTGEKLLANMGGFITADIDLEDTPTDWETLYSRQEAALSMNTHSPSLLAEQLNINAEIFLDIVNNAPHLTITDWISISDQYNRLVPEVPQGYVTLCSYWKMSNKANINNDQRVVDRLLEECVNESYRNFDKHDWRYIRELYNKIALVAKNDKQLNDRWHCYLDPNTKSLTEEDKEIVLRFFKTDLSAFRPKEGRMNYRGIQSALMKHPDIVTLHMRIYGCVYPLRCKELQNLCATANTQSSAEIGAASSSLRFFNSTPMQPSQGPLCSTMAICA